MLIFLFRLVSINVELDTSFNSVSILEPYIPDPIPSTILEPAAYRLMVFLFSFEILS